MLYNYLSKHTKSCSLNWAQAGTKQAGNRCPNHPRSFKQGCNSLLPEQISSGRNQQAKRNHLRTAEQVSVVILQKPKLQED